MELELRKFDAIEATVLHCALLLHRGTAPMVISVQSCAIRCIGHWLTYTIKE